MRQVRVLVGGEPRCQEGAVAEGDLCGPDAIIVAVRRSGVQQAPDQCCGSTFWIPQSDVCGDSSNW